MIVAIIDHHWANFFFVPVNFGRYLIYETKYEIEENCPEVPGELRYLFFKKSYDVPSPEF